MLNLLIPFFGNVPPPKPPVVAALALSPANPGDLGLAPATWTTRITATGGLTQVKWAVMVPGAKSIDFDRIAFLLLVRSALKPLLLARKRRFPMFGLPSRVRVEPGSLATPLLI
jgi:hypothetical protein